MIPREQHLDDEEQRQAKSAEPFERDEGETARRGGYERCPTPWYARREPRNAAPMRRFPAKKRST